MNPTRQRGIRQHAAVDGRIVVWVLLVALGVCFRFAHLDRKVYWLDEVFTSLWISGHDVPDLDRDLPHDRPFSISALEPYKHLNPETGPAAIIRVLAATRPHQPPLYPILLWGWAQWLGDSVNALRGLSALLSVVALPLMFWLSRELFADRQVAWLVVALMAISPFHVLYAQETRAYSLWTVETLWSSAALLRALRHDSVAAWAVYTLSLALGWYTHLFFAAVAAAHALYVLGLWRVRATRNPRSYLLAALAGTLPFIPWLMNLAVRRDYMDQAMAWVTQSADSSIWFKAIVLNFACAYFDARMPEAAAVRFLSVPIVALVAVSLWWTCRATPARTSWFVVTLIGTLALSLIVPDLLIGGQRFAVMRYAIPCFIGTQLAVAGFLSARLRSSVLGRWSQTLWPAIVIGLVVLGTWSCAVSFSAHVWYTKAFNRYNFEIAQALRQTPHPFVAGDRAEALLTLSYAIDSGVDVLLVSNRAAPEIPPTTVDAWIYSPSPSLRQWLVQQTQWSVEREPEDWQLWRLSRVPE